MFRRQFRVPRLYKTSIYISGSSYAMMASYLSNGGRMPEALKHVVPEMQQYWSAAAHSEGNGFISIVGLITSYGIV